MADLVPAGQLATLMDEITAGEWTMSGQLSQISEKCFGWKYAYPDQFSAAYDRFERARQAVRHDATEEEWQELRAAANQLGTAFQVAAG